MNKVIHSLNSAKSLLKVIGEAFGKHASELYLVSSTVAGVATVVSACKATLDIQPAVEEFKTCVNDINEYTDEKLDNAKTTSEVAEIKAYKANALKEEKIKLAKVAVKSYARTVACAATTILLVKCGVNLKNKEIRSLKDENAAISSALMAQISDFNKYRKNVIADQGEEKDQEYRYGIETITEEVKTIGKNGKEKVTYETRKVIQDDLPSLVRCISEESCGLCTTVGDIYDKENGELIRSEHGFPVYKGNQFLLTMLKDIEHQIQEEIRINGGITVERIDNLLKMDINLTTPEAEFNRNAGYIWDPHAPFSFNLYDVKDPDKVDFYNGYEHRILIEIPINSVNVCRDLRELAKLKSRKRRGLPA